MQEVVLIITDDEFNEVDVRMINYKVPPVVGDFVCLGDGKPVYIAIVRLFGESLKVFLQPTSLDGGLSPVMNPKRSLKLQQLVSKHRYANQPDLDLPHSTPS